MDLIKLKELEEQVLENRSQIATDSYPMSIGEIANLFNDEDLIIKPEFQREFRWSKGQKTKLIESILLDIPLPSFFLAANKEGKWEVVDGLQRLSTIFEFMNLLDSDTKKLIRDGNEIYNGLDKIEIRYLTKLSGLTWDDIGKNLQRDIKRYKINLNIIKYRKESSLKTKYELFQRLNTGGTQLSNQEIKNCIMIMENKELYNFISKLSENEDFIECLSLSESDFEEKYHYELILRFFALFYYNEGDEIDSVSGFIDNSMLKFIDSFNYKESEEIFSKTFNILRNVLGEDVFKRYYSEEGKFKRKMLIPMYDILTLFVSKNLNIDFDYNKFKEKIKDIWKDEEFNKKIGVGPRIKAKLQYALNNYNNIFNKDDLKK